MATSPPPEHVERSGGVFQGLDLAGRTSRSSNRTEPGPTPNRRVNASMASSQQSLHDASNPGRPGSTSGGHEYPLQTLPSTSFPNHPPRSRLDDDSAHSLPPMGPPPTFPSSQPSPLPLPLPIPTKELYYSEHKLEGFLHSLSQYTEGFLRQLYFNMHLRLPSHYFSRVAMIFENAALTMTEVREMIDAAKHGGHAHGRRSLGGGYVTSLGRIRRPTAYEKIEKSWNTLIESLLREWETLNVVSALLLSAILTILQIEDAASYYVTRYTAFASLVCALMSLLYGCLFIARFASMKDTTRSVRWASEWAEEAGRYKVPILWNVWVMLALPSTFLCWAIACFVACIMSLMWHSALQSPNSSPSPSSSSSSTSSSSNTNGNAIPFHTGLVFCAVISAILFIGLAYLALIIVTFKKWGYRVRVWTETYNQALGLSDSSFPILDVGGIGVGGNGRGGQEEEEEEEEEESGGGRSVGRNAGVGGDSHLLEGFMRERRRNGSLHDLDHGEGNDVQRLPRPRPSPLLDELRVPTHSAVDMQIQSS